MTKGTRALIGIVLVFSLLLSGIGYASLTDSLAVTGSANAEAPEEVFIYELTNAVGIVNPVHTALSIVANSVTFDSDGYAYVDVSLFNNTPDEYMYYGMTVSRPAADAFSGTMFYSNGDVYDYGWDGIENVQESKEGELISPLERLTLTLRLEGNPGETLNDVGLYFTFVDSNAHVGWEKIEGALEQFGAILNDTAPGGKNEQMINALLQNGGSIGGNATYIGNVAGDGGDDDMTVSDLFKDANGNSLLDVDLDGDGNPDEVTVMIKAQNLDGNTNTGITIDPDGWLSTGVNGGEMTIYMTPAILGDQEGSNVNRGDYVVVYAANFYQITNAQGNQEWVQIGPMLAGVCTVNGYNSPLYLGNDSINTGSWRSTVTYTVNGVEYAPGYIIPDNWDKDASQPIEGGTTGTGGQNLATLFNAFFEASGYDD